MTRRYSPDDALGPGTWVHGRNGILRWHPAVVHRPPPAEVVEEAPTAGLAPDEHVDLAIRTAAHLFGTTLEDALSRSAAESDRATRMVAMVALRRAGYSTPQIGRIFGRDHSTVLHATRRCEGISDRLEYATRIHELITVPVESEAA